MLQEIDEIMLFSIGNRFVYDSIRKDVINSRNQQGGIMPFVGDELTKFAFGSKDDFVKEVFQNISISLEPEENARLEEKIQGGDFLNALDELINIFKERGHGELILDKILLDFYDTSKIDIDLLPNQPVSLVPFIGKGDTVTVNFDRVLEYAYELGRISPEIVTPYNQKKLNMKLRDTNNSDSLLLKIHGDITSNANERIFTKATFDEQYKKDSNFVKNLEKWINNYKILFIGVDLIKEKYLVELLGKTRAQGVYHYAIVGCENDSEKKKDLIKKLEDINISPILYDINKPGSIEILLHKLLVDSKNTDVFKRGDLDYKFSDHGLVGRYKEINELQRFLAYDHKIGCDFKWWIIYGTNITGKSKLAYEFARKYADGWQWYMLGPEQIDGFIARQIKSERTRKKKRRVFIILDDYDWYSGGVSKILKFVNQISRHCSQIRILFILRDARKAEITKIILNKEEKPIEDEIKKMLISSGFGAPQEIVQLSVQDIKSVCYSYLMYRRTELGLAELDTTPDLYKKVDKELEEYINNLLGNSDSLVLVLCLKKIISLIMRELGIKNGYLSDKEIITQVLRYVITTGEGSFNNENINVIEIDKQRDERKKQGNELLEKTDKEKQYDKEFQEDILIKETFIESFKDT